MADVGSTDVQGKNRPDPCPRCGRTSGDPARSVVVAVRDAIEQAEREHAEVLARLRNRMQSALFAADEGGDD